MKILPGQKMRVACFGDGYVEKRVLIDLPFRNVVLQRRRDIFNAITFAQRILGRPPTATTLTNCLHYDFGLRDIHLNHILNSISFSSTPWVVTYEHYLPRWNQQSNCGWRYLASPSCKKIIAISDWALKFQQHLLLQHPELADIIHPKLCVVTPSQKMLVRQYDDKVLDPERITFTMVGGDFFRKGGMEILEVFVQLVEEKLPVHLTIVSSLAYGDYASKATQADYERARVLIARLGSHVTPYHSLANARVLDLFTGSHVGLLPTYDDTYGFSGLEAQAAGCPVISTDGCALPEFNSNDEGWIISVPKNSLNQPLRRTEEERQQLSSCIRENLFRIVREICANPSSIRIKGERALARIRNHHAPEDRVTLIESIYREALA